MMFTGIVEEVGSVAQILEQDDSLRLRISALVVTDGAQHGGSISVNGTCLTISDHGRDWFEADVMRETLERTSLRTLQPGSKVNLERAVRVDGRLGGHIVQGHVDGVGRVEAVEPTEHWTVMRCDVGPELTRYMVEKGSICVDGVSLTIVSVGPDDFSVSLIPTTLSDTTLGETLKGDVVNIEVDVLAKYVEKLVRSDSC
jgi:riboflavin synthase